MFDRKGFTEYVGGTSGNSYASGLTNIESLYSADIDVEYDNNQCAILLSKIEKDKKRKDLSENELHYRRNYFSHLKKYIEYRMNSDAIKQRKEFITWMQKQPRREDASKFYSDETINAAADKLQFGFKALGIGKYTDSNCFTIHDTNRFAEIYNDCYVPAESLDKKQGHRDFRNGLEFYMQFLNVQNGTATDKENIYWPSLDEYNPGITKEMWTEILRDVNIATVETIDMLKKMCELGGESTCAHLAEVYGNTSAHYNGLGSTFGRRVKDKYNCPDCIDKESDTTDRNRVYVIPFVGRNVKENGNQRYSWKLRDELREALESMGINWGESETNIELNTILFGPPGTGKTYHTAIYAVAIIENRKLEDIAADEYNDVMRRYNTYRKEGRIAFTTFHQSYGYEEFIEGIKPVIDSKDIVQYSVEDGVFKAFCKTASMPEDIKINHNAKVWKVVLKSGDLVQTNTVKFECFIEGKIMYDWDTQQDHIGSYTYSQIEHFRDRVNIGDIVLTYAGHGTDIDAVGIVTGDAVYDEKVPEFKWSRTVEWFQYNNVVNIRDLNGGKYLDNDSLQELKRVNIADLFRLLGHCADAPTTKNFVFIIDEINRGNISKIFGELITLIEPSKRVGAAEEMTALLPYSAKPFGIPNNVYIIGTMNTADRSIATIDTALRRRFNFTEMLPNPSVLQDIYVEDVSVSEMLDLINKRISVLYDREHTIGHAYFFPLRDNPTVDTLARIFENNIIPLLQEYFYEDYEKIRLVLGDNHKSEDAQFVVAKSNDYVSLFGNIDIGLDDGFSYEINKRAFTNIEAYRSI